MSYPVHDTTYFDVRRPSFFCRARHAWGTPINGHVICMTCLSRWKADIEMVPAHAPMSATTEAEIENLQRELAQSGRRE